MGLWSYWLLLKLKVEILNYSLILINNINKYNDKSIEESKNIEVDIRLRKENSIFIVEIQNIKTKEYVEMYRTTSYEHSIDLANKYIKDFNMIGIDINVTNDIK